MKWYFAVSETSFVFDGHDWPNLIRASVLSALRNTTLRPHLLYDGQPSAFTAELEALGVKVILHRVSFYDHLADHAAKEGLHHGWLKTASGAFLRFDIPVLEQEDDLVLYTDCDVLFMRDPAVASLPRPTYFAAAPQMTLDYADMNSGVMLINVPEMREDYKNLVRFTVKNLHLDFDQPILRARYANCYQSLPLTMNWKPYWGLNEQAEIVHFHGPKPPMVRRYQIDRDLTIDPILKSLLDRNPGSYQTYLALWEKALLDGRPTLTLDQLDADIAAGWAVYKDDPARRVTLTAMAGGQDILTFDCRQPRPDVAAAGVATAQCGFRIPLPKAAAGRARRLQFRDPNGKIAEVFKDGVRLDQIEIPGRATAPT